MQHTRPAVVVITGASSGIGQATAMAFARHGARLVLAARGRSSLERIAEDCRGLGAEAMVVKTDVTDPTAVQHLAQQALAYGEIDVWVSNVGVGAVGKFHETPIEAHQQVINASLIGHMNDAHAVIPIFLRQGHGIFINMISLGGFAAAPFAAAYSAAKFGLRGFSEALRAELADKPDIHICDVYPAFVDTPGLAHGANYMGKRVTAPPPLIDPREVAAAILDITRSPRPTTTVGLVTNASRLAHLLAPNLSARVLARFMSAYFRRAEVVARSDGNLFRPPAEAGGIDGGLRSDKRLVERPVAIALLTIGMMAVGTVMAHRLKRRT